MRTIHNRALIPLLEQVVAKAANKLSSYFEMPLGKKKNWDEKVLAKIRIHIGVSFQRCRSFAKICVLHSGLKGIWNGEKIWFLASIFEM